MTAGCVANVANKIKRKVDGDNGHDYRNCASTYCPKLTYLREAPDSHHLGSAKHYGSGGNSGPHNSRICNKLDYRVDSSRDGQSPNEAFPPNIYYYPAAESTTAGSRETTSHSKQVWPTWTAPIIRALVQSSFVWMKRPSEGDASKDTPRQ
ncbi:hypothetical protein N7505_007689 [Penicillium chrysogenum]|uniref:Uncharacterized protein n=1 Tax=Penicillium chrysogenum TaxID=5076 RepID=A0ABQ8WEN6_PENCH|nr:hypothetical protein N7505_007689 [Penicillium chrysogenum]